MEIPGFEVLEKLGQGGTSTVYKARQKSMERIVALKILSPELAKDPAFQQRFLAEARASAKLVHRNIIQGIDVGKTADGIFYFVMEYVEGPTVGKLLRERKTLPEPETVMIMMQIARALEHAQRYQMTHKDIKPENIIVMKDGTAKLCDLGLAVYTENTSTPVGTPYYISPEQVEGQKIDVRSDIYSLGCTAYHMSTGKVPFGGSAMVIMSKHLTKPIPPPKDVNPDLSQGFCNILLKMLAKNPQDRYQNPGELLESLRTYSMENIEEEPKKNENDLDDLASRLRRKYQTRKRRRF